MQLSLDDTSSGLVIGDTPLSIVGSQGECLLLVLVEFNGCHTQYYV
jgi:hypothetical protein